jgi:hypothetical protein
MMTTHEARTIAIWRLHFGCDMQKIAELARTVWGIDSCSAMLENDFKVGEFVGLELVRRMASTLGIEESDLNEMKIVRVTCQPCQYGFFVISYPIDNARECPECGKMSGFMDALSEKS